MDPIRVNGKGPGLLARLFGSKPKNGLVGHSLGRPPDIDALPGAGTPDVLGELLADFTQQAAAASSVHSSTINIVKADQATVISLDETVVDRKQFLRDHPVLTTKILAEALTVGILREVVGDILMQNEGTGRIWTRRPISRRGALVPGDCVYHKLERTLSIFSDAHGHWPRLDYIISLVEEGLRNGTEELHCLGDLMHAESKENVYNLAWSLQTFKAYVMLMWLFPGQVHLYSGNHDVFCPTQEHFDLMMQFIAEKPNGHVFDVREHFIKGKKTPEGMAMLVRKEGIYQAYLFLHYICLALKEKNVDERKAYEIVNLFQQVIDRAPLCLRANIMDPKIEFDLFMAHSFPQGITTEAELRSIRDNESLLQGILWSRFNDPNNISTNINMGDVQQLRQAIRMRKGGVMIFGHDPDPSGAEWYCMPFGRDGRVVICHANIAYRFGILRVVKNGNGQYQIRRIDKECAPPNDPSELYLPH